MVGIHCHFPVPFSLPAIVKSGHEPFVDSVIGAGVIPTIPAPRVLSLHSVTPTGQPVVLVLKPVSSSSLLFLNHLNSNRHQMASNNVDDLFRRLPVASMDFEVQSLFLADHKQEQSDYPLMQLALQMLSFHQVYETLTLSALSVPALLLESERYQPFLVADVPINRLGILPDNV